MDPPRRASRYFAHADRLRSVQPDAFGILRGPGAVRPFFLEWEHREVRPVTMAARVAPYLRYHAIRRPIDGHGARLVLLVVFDDEPAAGHFLRVAVEEMRGAGIEVPLRVSHRGALDRVGPLGRAWRSPEKGEPGHAFAD